jgi:hypothetical protein
LSTHEKQKVTIPHTGSPHVLSSMGEAIDPLLINNVCCNAQRMCLVYRVYDEQCRNLFRLVAAQ